MLTGNQTHSRRCHPTDRCSTELFDTPAKRASIDKNMASLAAVVQFQLHEQWEHALVLKRATIVNPANKLINGLVEVRVKIETGFSIRFSAHPSQLFLVPRRRLFTGDAQAEEDYFKDTLRRIGRPENWSIPPPNIVPTKPLPNLPSDELRLILHGGVWKAVVLVAVQSNSNLLFRDTSNSHSITKDPKDLTQIPFQMRLLNSPFSPDDCNQRLAATNAVTRTNAWVKTKPIDEQRYSIPVTHESGRYPAHASKWRSTEWFLSFSGQRLHASDFENDIPRPYSQGPFPAAPELMLPPRMSPEINLAANDGLPDQSSDESDVDDGSDHKKLDSWMTGGFGYPAHTDGDDAPSGQASPPGSPGSPQGSPPPDAQPQPGDHGSPIKLDQESDPEDFEYNEENYHVFFGEPPEPPTDPPFPVSDEKMLRALARQREQFELSSARYWEMRSDRLQRADTVRHYGNNL